jgi:hypothetical protein
VPATVKTEALIEIEDWLAGVLRGTDSSLLDEWQRLKNPQWQPREEAIVEAPDITRNKREFTALLRTEIFRFMRQLSFGQYANALAGLVAVDHTAESLADTMDAYYEEHSSMILDNEARNGRHTYTEALANQQMWKVSQVIVDPEEQNDWQIQFTVDLNQARDDGKPTLQLVSIGPI